MGLLPSLVHLSQLCPTGGSNNMPKRARSHSQAGDIAQRKVFGIQELFAQILVMLKTNADESETYKSVCNAVSAWCSLNKDHRLACADEQMWATLITNVFSPNARPAPANTTNHAWFFELCRWYQRMVKANARIDAYMTRMEEANKEALEASQTLQAREQEMIREYDLPTGWEGHARFSTLNPFNVRLYAQLKKELDELKKASKVAHSKADAIDDDPSFDADNAELRLAIFHLWGTGQVDTADGFKRMPEIVKLTLTRFTH